MTPQSRILLVDDEVAIQRAVGPLLRSRGYEVDVAGTGADALEMFAERPPDLDRARSRPARFGRHGSLPAHPRETPRCRSSCSRRAARKPTRSTRSISAPTTTSPSRSVRRSCWRAFASRCAEWCRRTSAETGLFRAGDLTIDYDRRRVLRERDGDPADAQGIRAAVAAGPESRSRVDASRDPQGDLGAERGRAAGAPVDAGCPAAQEDRARPRESAVPPQRTLGRLSVCDRAHAARSREFSSGSSSKRPVFEQQTLSGRSELMLRERLFKCAQLILAFGRAVRFSAEGQRERTNVAVAARERHDRL